MSSVDADIVREYFEGNGFLVRSLRRYPVFSSRKAAEAGADLFVSNPRYEAGSRQPSFLLFASELPLIEKAVVAVTEGHPSHFNPGVLMSSAKFYRFLEKDVAKRVVFRLPEGEEDLSRILVLPGLPTKEPFRTQTIELLRSRGVDGILSFRSMLLDLIERIEMNRNYETSVLFETIRLLKNYDLIKDSQMELFRRAPE